MDEMNFVSTIEATCSICGKTEEFPITEEEQHMSKMSN